MIGTVDWASAEIGRIKHKYERFVEEANARQVTVYQIAGRENLYNLERELEAPLNIVARSTDIDDISLYCAANALMDSISAALNPHS